MTSVWIRVVSWLVPREERADWREEWLAELSFRSGSMTHAWGALADAWYLRTDGWTMDGMLRDMRMAVRSLVRKPFFTALAGVTLAVGIGANTAIYSIVDGVLIDPLPFPGSERLVSYNHEAPGLGVNVPVIPLSQAMFLHYSEGARSLQGLTAFEQGNVNLIFDGEPQRVEALEATAGYFDVIGVQPFLGRGFAPGEDEPGAEPVAVLSYALWEQSFGSDPDVLGTLVEMDGVQRRVIGVLPRDQVFSDEDVWIPLVIDRTAPEIGSLGLIGVGRLADGATVESAGVEMQDLLLRFAEANADELPPSVMEQTGLAADVKPLKQLYAEDLSQALWLLLGTVGFVLLIACANVANLFLVRAEGRQREQAVRTAMGATRGDVVRQYLTEAMALALGGGLLGLGLAAIGVPALMKIAPAQLPQALDVGIDGTVLAFTAAISVAAGVLFGLFPVFGYARKDLSNALKDGGRASTTGKERHRARSSLVVAQVALALVLLVGSGLMLRSFRAMANVDLGFESEGVLTFSVGLPDAEYPDADQVLNFHRRLMDRLASVPGVVAVGSINGAPLTGQKNAGAMEPTDQPFGEGQLGPIVERRVVTPGYFAAMGIEIVDGRPFEWTDQANEFRGIVISRTLASRFWPGESAVGQRIRSQGADFDWEVVGVADVVRFDNVQDEPTALAYLPVISGAPEALQPSRYLDVMVRTAGDPLDLVGSSRGALREVGPRLPMLNPRTMDSVVRDAMTATSFTVILLGIASGIALLLGSVGLYGVISYIVSRRTQEIGVRMALGAPGQTVMRSVVGQGLRLTAIGVVLGLAGAFALSRLIASLLYGVSATDPVTFVGMPLLLTAIATLAAWIPARRASRVDPVEALRSE